MMKTKIRNIYVYKHSNNINYFGIDLRSWYVLEIFFFFAFMQINYSSIYLY